jgi:predicted ATP-grasp superfamily ATP-dependent carboligase
MQSALLSESFTVPSGATGRGILLCDAGYYGTLAAARALGRDGVSVTVVDSQPSEPTLWSRHVRQKFQCPPIDDTERFVAWLLRFGESQPGHVLYATSDELCFVLSLYREELSKNFCLYQPEFSVLAGILDKGVLMQQARAAGLDTPETWLPTNEVDVESAVREARGPLMIKPRTQIMLTTHAKGALAPKNARGARAEYARFVRSNRYARPVRERLSAATRPMLQRFYPEAMNGVYSLAGFRDRAGRHFVAMGANKVLQRPRTMGVGLCFEPAPVEPDLAKKVERLLDRIGYYGVFEVEFIRADNRWLLIDYNPRFYGQMALDIVRGLPLPQLAYAGASGNEAEIARLIRGVPANGDGLHAFCNKFSLRVLLGAQRLFGGMTREEIASWRSWRLAKGASLVDAVADPDDPGPYVAEVYKQLRSYVLDPRLFWRIHRPRPPQS